MDSDLVMTLVEQGGPAAVVAAVVLVVGGLVLRWQVWRAVGSGEAIAGGAEVDKQLREVAQRLAEMERDLESRATREEMHQLELGLARLEGRLDTLHAGMQATAAAVSRIEDYMIEYSKNAAKRGGG